MLVRLRLDRHPQHRTLQRPPRQAPRPDVDTAVDQPLVLVRPDHLQDRPRRLRQHIDIS